MMLNNTMFGGPTRIKSPSYKERGKMARDRNDIGTETSGGTEMYPQKQMLFARTKEICTNGSSLYFLSIQKYFFWLLCEFKYIITVWH